MCGLDIYIISGRSFLSSYKKRKQPHTPVQSASALLFPLYPCWWRYFSLVAIPPRMWRSDLLVSRTLRASWARVGLICRRRSVTSLCAVVMILNCFIFSRAIFDQYRFIQPQISQKFQVNIHVSVLVHLDLLNVPSLSTSIF